MSITSRLGKLRGRSLAELRERMGQKVAAQREAWGFSPDVQLLSDAGFAAELVLPHGASANDANALRAHFTSRTEPAFFAGVRDGASAAEIRLPHWSQARDALIVSADRILAGQYDLLGHTALSFGSPIDWHLDPTTGRRAPEAHWSRIPYLDASVIGDHKVIWEINRHQHFFVLGRAFQVTGNTAYAEHFAEQLSSWMDTNPPKRGVNWASSLEVAYRSIAWLWALELFRESPALTPEILSRALKHLYANGRHLERYLSTYFSPNTHLTGEALGLLYLGVLLPEFRRSATWRELGWEILERHLPRQVYEDGVYFEQATYYHRYTADIYLHAVMLAHMHGMPIRPSMTERLDAAVGHLADLTRADGTIPIIGDDDGGRLVVLETRPFADVRAVLGVAARVLVHPEYATVAGPPTEEVVWMLGPTGAHAPVTEKTPAHTSKLFAEGGYAVMRDGWGSHANHAVIDAGPLGTMNCGHAHSDALSIELFAGGCPVLVDPGTFTYTVSPELRDRFRHSAAHNTLTVDGESASTPNGAFSWAHRTDARVEQWWTGSRLDRFVGSHGGFQRLADPVVHRRAVLFMRGEYWVIVDSVEAQGDHESVAHFHTAIGSSVDPISARSAWISARCASGSSRLLFSVAGDVDALEWGEDWVSPSYGSRLLAPYGRVTARGGGRRDLITVLVPSIGGGEISVREIAAQSGRAVQVDRHGTSDVILIATGGAVATLGVEAAADMALLRRVPTSGEIEMVALFGSHASLSVDGLAFSARDGAEFVRGAEGWVVEGDGSVVN